MIQNFNEWIIINEGRDADLYHWMDEDKVEDLYFDDTMFGQWIHNIDGIKRNGNSFSRNKNLNYRYVVRLTIDQSKLSSTHRIIPIDGEKVYHTTRQDGKIVSDRNPKKFSAILNYGPGQQFKSFNQKILAEEFILGDIKKMHTYIKKVEMFEQIGFTWISDENLNKLQSYCGRWKIPFEENKRSNL